MVGELLDRVEKLELQMNQVQLMLDALQEAHRTTTVYDAAPIYSKDTDFPALFAKKGLSDE